MLRIERYTYGFWGANEKHTRRIVYVACGIGKRIECDGKCRAALGAWYNATSVCLHEKHKSVLYKEEGKAA